MDGKPMPSTIDATMVSSKVKNSEPAPKVTMDDVITVPKLVKFTTPITMPTTAHAAMTDSDCLAPSSSAAKMSLKPMRVSGRSQLIMMVAPMV